jgi:hypothetical protein
MLFPRLQIQHLNPERKYGEKKNDMIFPEAISFPGI